jgi:FkbM family methyltransferase
MLMKAFKEKISLAVKERVLNHYLIPFSRDGVNPGVLRYFKAALPISLVDVGASCGDFTKSMQTHYGVRRAMLVEPQPARCRELEARFCGPRFSIHQCALSDQETNCKMEVLNFDYSSSILPVRRDLPNVSATLDLNVREKITCRVTTLDTLLREAGWSESVDLLKIDVQGAELLMLRGAAESLPRVRFVLSEVSFQPLYEGSALFQEVYDLLTSEGFRLLWLNDAFRGQDGELLQSDALFGR